MKDYHVSFDLKAEGSIENVKKILERGKELGFIYEGKSDKVLSIDEALDEISKNRCLNFIIDDVVFGFYSSIMSFDVYDHSFRWKKQFRHMYIPDNVKVIDLLLQLTHDFIVESMYISSYLQLLYDVERKDGAITVNSLLTSQRLPKGITDGEDIMVQTIRHGYKFIVNPTDPTSCMSIISMAESLDKVMDSKKKHEFYLCVEGYIMTFELTPEIVSIIVREPIKIKVVDGQQDYDRAFYTHILVNLLENIGIDELVCTL